MYAHLRTLRLADDPDEVHKRTIAQRELRRHAAPAGGAAAGNGSGAAASMTEGR